MILIKTTESKQPNTKNKYFRSAISPLTTTLHAMEAYAETLANHAIKLRHMTVFHPSNFSLKNLIYLFTISLLSGCLQTGQEVIHPSVYSTDENTQKPVTEATPLNLNPKLCASGVAAKVLKIIDGDTIDVRLKDGTEERVRYIGIDTPERDEACYQEASDRNTMLVERDSVKLIKDTSERDIYGRLVRYICNSEGVFVNAQLISEGMAYAYRYYPDTGFANQFKLLEQEAAQAGIGCLHPEANSDASNSACCKMCRNGKACGDSCIPWNQSCHHKPGCACQG